MLYPIRDALAEQAAIDATRRAQERQSMRANGDERWYLARIGNRSDDNAITMLIRHEFECYYPKLRKMIPIPLNRLSHKQRKSRFTPFQPKDVALFPKYLLVRFDLRRGDWGEIFEAAGIWGMQVYKDAARPIPVPVSDAIVASIRSREVNGAVPPDTPVRIFAYEIGEVVRVTEGAFRGFDAIVETLTASPLGDIDEGALWEFTVFLFGRPNLVEMPLSHVAKL